MSDERDALALAWGQGYHRGRLDEAEGLDKPPNPYRVIANAVDDTGETQDAPCETPQRASEGLAGSPVGDCLWDEAQRLTEAQNNLWLTSHYIWPTRVVLGADESHIVRGAE